MMEAKTIQLRKSVIIGKGDSAKTFDSIVLREPLAGDYEVAERLTGTVDFAVALTAIVAGIPVDAVDHMGVSVTADAMTFFNTFAEAGGDAPASDDDWTLELSAPIELKDVKTDKVEMSYSALNLSEPSNLQRRKSGQAGGPYASAIALVALSSGVPKAIVKKMPASEFLLAVKYLKGFQERRQATALD